MNLTVSGSGVAVYPPGATFGPRRLPDFEFVWLLQGTAEWHYEDGSIALGTNSLLLGRPPDAVDGAELPPADAHRLVPQGLHLAGGQRVRQDGVPVLLVLVLVHGASVRWRRRG